MTSEQNDLIEATFGSLIGSFKRWKDEISRTIPYPPRAENEDWAEYAEKYSLPPAPRSFLFIANLPTVDVKDLSEDKLQCSICLDSYITKGDEVGPEIPTRLPCGHILGNRCLRRWVFPYGDGETCPLCRADCLLEDVGFNPGSMRYKHIDGREIAYDEEVWAGHEGGNCLSEPRRAWVRRCRYRIAVKRLNKARDALIRHVVSVKRSLKMDDDFDEAASLVVAERWNKKWIAVDEMEEQIVAARDMYEADNEMGRTEYEWV